VEGVREEKPKSIIRKTPERHRTPSRVIIEERARDPNNPFRQAAEVGRQRILYREELKRRIDDPETAPADLQKYIHAYNHGKIPEHTPVPLPPPKRRQKAPGVATIDGNRSVGGFTIDSEIEQQVKNNFQNAPKSPSINRRLEF
jgi:hypothetical protein